MAVYTQPHITQCGFPERCRSGRTGLTRNQVIPYGIRGFKSHPLRHLVFGNKLDKMHEYLVRCPGLDMKTSVAAPHLLHFRWFKYQSVAILLLCYHPC